MSKFILNQPELGEILIEEIRLLLGIEKGFEIVKVE